MVYNDSNFDQSKINLLNTYRETLEDKLKKKLQITEEISVFIEDGKEYEIESQTANDTELKIRKETETLKSFIHTHWQTQRTNNTVQEEINWPTHWVELPKFEIKPFSGKPVEWTFIESFTAAADKNNFLINIEKMTYWLLRDETTTMVNKGLSLYNENHSVALKMLEERFGNPQLLIRKRMIKLLSLS